MLRRSIRASLRIAITYGLATAQTTLLASYLQISLISSGSKWLLASANVVSLAFAVSSHAKPVEAAASLVENWIGKELKEVVLVATVGEFLANAIGDLVAMGLWNHLLEAGSTGDVIPTYFFARDDRVTKYVRCPTSISPRRADSSGVCGTASTRSRPLAASRRSQCRRRGSRSRLCWTCSRGGRWGGKSGSRSSGRRWTTRSPVVPVASCNPDSSSSRAQNRAQPARTVTRCLPSALMSPPFPPLTLFAPGHSVTAALAARPSSTPGRAAKRLFPKRHLLRRFLHRFQLKHQLLSGREWTAEELTEARQRGQFGDGAVSDLFLAVRPAPPWLWRSSQGARCMQMS